MDHVENESWKTLDSDFKDLIRVGDFVIVQRQGYTKLHKMKPHSKLMLGSFTVEMDNILGEKYFDTFQMKNKPESKKFYVLDKVKEINSATGTVSIETSGVDNRHIPNNAESQTLTREDIDKLKEEELSSNNIVEQLISNSKTFNLKTEYSQEKYIKKKEKKYFEYIQIRRPTIRILAQMFYRQDPTKTLGIRLDDLSQILTYANIQQDGNHLLYDSGTSGLMSAAITDAIGCKTTGHLIHMHPGNECQKNGFIAMQFSQEQSRRCINVNVYSVLRCFYQQKRTSKSHSEDDNIEDNCDSEDGPSSKKVKLDAVLRRSWEIENDRACEILTKKVDSLIVVVKEHPVNIVKELLPFLNGNRNLVVFSIVKEPLQDLYFYLKNRVDIIFIRLMSSFMRDYQVLPERTHPEVNMSMGGYILTAIKLCD